MTGFSSTVGATTTKIVPLVAGVLVAGDVSNAGGHWFLAQDVFFGFGCANDPLGVERVVKAWGDLLL